MPSHNNFFYIDLSDEGHWLIKSKDGKRYTAGFDKEKAEKLITKLNEAHRPNVHQGEVNEIFVCWNNHERSQDCDYVQEI